MKVHAIFYGKQVADMLLVHVKLSSVLVKRCSWDITLGVPTKSTGGLPGFWTTILSFNKKS